MKYQIDHQPEDNTYFAQIWTGPDGIDAANFVCASLSECFEQFIKYETINGLTYADSPAAAIRSYFENLNKNQFTVFELKELEKCRNSPKYFINKYIKGIILRDYQEELFDSFENHKITLGLMCRQSGKTLTPILYALHQIIFNQNYTVSVNSFSFYNTEHCLDAIKGLYYNIPEFFMRFAPVSISNQTKFKLDNGSAFYIEPKTENWTHMMSGLTPDLTILDEYASWKRKDALDFMHCIAPVLWSKKSTKMIVCSTPNCSYVLDENMKRVKQHFYDLWTNDNPNANKIRVSYEQVPFDNIKQMRLSMAPIDFAREYNASFITGEF
jgi:hypothetical protein